MTGSGILYYAMGGGLGHLTRTAAILEHCHELRDSVRVLASSPLTHMVRSTVSVPIDEVPSLILTSRSAYHRYLLDYIQRYNIRFIVLDTFPWGIVGEWSEVGLEIPRVLIGRSLRWDNYLERVGSRQGSMPGHALVIEPIEKRYWEILKRVSNVSRLNAPILSTAFNKTGPSDGNRWLVVHSGDETEQATLMDLARQRMKEYGQDSETTTVDTVFPGQGIYPAFEKAKAYKYIVSGAGYNMTAQALLCNGKREYILFPFERKFDDQCERLRLYEKEEWGESVTSGATDAAKWLISIKR